MVVATGFEVNQRIQPVATNWLIQPEQNLFGLLFYLVTMPALTRIISLNTGVHRSSICNDAVEDALAHLAEGHISFIADPHAVPRLNPQD